MDSNVTRKDSEINPFLANNNIIVPLCKGVQTLPDLEEGGIGLVILMPEKNTQMCMRSN